MKTLILVSLTLATGAAFAQPRNTQKECYRVMDPSTKKTGKAAVVMANSDAAWDVLIDDITSKAVADCKEGAGYTSCIDDFLDHLHSCEGVVHTPTIQKNIADLKRAAEAHSSGTHKAPVAISAEQGTANK
jgi:hypothetical protein